MEQVTLQAIKQMRLSRSGGKGVTGNDSNADGFMQMIDAMIGNITDGESSVSLPELLFGDSQKSDEDVTDDASLLSMLSELLQSGGGNLSEDIFSLLKNVAGIESIDKVEIPNLISKLQENNFFEAMGMDEDTADTLYTMGNNAYDYVDAQTEVVRNYINSKLEATETTEKTVVTGTMQTAEVKNAESKVTNEMPIASVTFEKASETQLVQPTGVTVPNMVSQRIVKADLSALGQVNDDNNNGNSNANETNDFNAQLSEIAMANASSNAVQSEIELPKAETLSNPLFNEFNIAEQITDGVKANINLEKSEFTVKLNPEELGELTLKLVEENGKMVLDITAASEKTARLLNGDIAALRDSVGSMNIELREVTVSAPEEIQENNAQFNMTSQQFSEQQRAFQNQQQQGNKPYYAAGHEAYGAEMVTQDYAGRIKSAVDGLDTYV